MEVHEFHAQEESSELTSSDIELPSTPQIPNTPEGSMSVTPISVGGTQAVSHSIGSMTIFPLSIPVWGSLAAAVLFILVFTLVRRRNSSTKGSAILLTGPSDAGKTAIYSALVYERVLPSHTSLQTNSSLIMLSSSTSEKQLRTIQLFDIPGHPRIRDQFKGHLTEAKGVVFVVDASTIARNGAIVAEHLHHILHALTSLPPSHLPPSLVVLAHKCDLLATSSSGATLAVSRVRTVLERELERRRASQAAGVGVGLLGEDEGADAELGGLECSGRGDGGFKFKDWDGGEIEILGSSVNVERGNIDSEKVLEGLVDLKRWLHDLP